MSIEPIIEATVSSELQVPSLSDHLAARRELAVHGSRELLEPASMPKFAVTFRGYARSEVDGYVESQRRHLASMRARAMEAERRLAELHTPSLPRADAPSLSARAALAPPRATEPLLPPPPFTGRGSLPARPVRTVPRRTALVPSPLPRRLDEAEFAVRRQRLGLVPSAPGARAPLAVVHPGTALVVTRPERTPVGGSRHASDHIHVEGRVAPFGDVPDVPEPLFYVPPLMPDILEPVPTPDALDSALAAIARALTVQSGASVTHTGSSDDRSSNSAAPSPAVAGDTVVELLGPDGVIAPTSTTASVGVGSVSLDVVASVSSPTPPAETPEGGLPTTEADFAAMAELLTAVLAVQPAATGVEPLGFESGDVENVIDIRQAAAARA